jgi:primosomal protein N' (replication factor Y) (superfamily II helicase)
MIKRFILHCALPIPQQRLFDYLPPYGVEHSHLQPGVRLKLPVGGKRVVIGFLIRVSEHSDWPETQLKYAYQLLDDTPLWQSALWQTLLWASQYYHHPLGDVLNSALPLKLRKGGDEPVDTPGFRATSLGFSCDLQVLSRSARQQKALTLLKEHPKGLTLTFLKSAGIDTQLLRSLQQKQLIDSITLARFQSVNCDDPIIEPQTLREAHLSLSPQQADACAQVLAARRQFQCFCLDGITGSGKTEVYLQLIEALQSEHLQTLVLVPEITLTPQTIRRFKARFRFPIALYHSELSDTEKADTWTQAKLGHARVIIGTRSSVFLPLKHPGLIIIDEEHDGAFKQQDGFQYSARDLALMRAHKEKIPVLLGSATPSLETLYNCQQGKYTHLILDQRAGGSQQSRYKVVDIRNQPLQFGLSDTVIGKIRDTLKDEQQVMVFLNRRGYAPILMCHHCGLHLPCPHCDAKLTVHKKQQQLRCHHCNYHQPLPSHCPKCQHDDLQYMGQGTEKLDGHLQELFPGFEVLRFDRDVVRHKQQLEQQLTRIEQGGPLLLIGTQMLSKGHHFPKVTLVVIVDADAGLFSLDFRASEHLAQLITQVGGRAGRANLPGEVWLQSRQPQHPVLITLLQQGYPAFAQLCLQERKATCLPPYSHLALLRAEAVQDETVLEFLAMALALANELQAMLFANEPGTVSIQGPVPAPMARRAGYKRYQLLFQAQQRPTLHQLLDKLLPSLERDQRNRRLRWSLDVDPIELY